MTVLNFNLKNRSLFLISIALGIALSISLSVYLIQLRQFSTNQFLFLLTILALFFFALSFWLLPQILSGISEYSLRTKRLWVLCCLVAGMGLVFVLPLNTTAPSYHTLKIIATGDHNAQAKGSEVWLYAMHTRNGLNLNKVVSLPNKGWEYRANALVSYQNQPAITTYKGVFSGDLTLNLGSHPWSGQVLIILDNNQKLIDLYSATTTSKVVVLPIASSRLLSLIVLIGSVLTLTFILFITSVWFVTSLIVQPAVNLPPVKDTIKPEVVFLVLGLFFGISFAVITPPFQVADENQHFSYAYAVSIGKFSGFRSVIPDSIQQLMTLTQRLPLKPDVKVSYSELMKFTDTPLDLNKLAPSFYQGVAKVNPTPYIPSAIGIEIAKLLNLNALSFFWFGRIFDLCVWIFLSYLALRLLPGYKWMFVLLLLSPMSLSLAASYSADVITDSICFLWIALCFHYSSVQENGIGTKSQIWLILAGALLALMKPPYQILMLLFFMIPRKNFGSQREYWRTVILLFTISFIPFLFSLSYLFRNDISTTNSRPGLDFRAQAHHLLRDPLEFPNIISRSLGYFGTFYYTSYIGRLGWLDTVLPQYIYATYPLIFFWISAVDQKDQSLFTPWQKFVSLITAVGLFLAIVLSLYLTWTPVGYKTLEGLQGRYLIPIGPLLIPLFVNNRFASKSLNWKGIPIAIYIVIVLSITIRTIILRYYIQ